MSKFMKFALAGIMATALGVSQARAEGPAPAPKADKPVRAAAPLTDESLQTMLENMGYDAKEEKLEKTTIYTVKIDQGDWTYYIDLALSNDKDQLWITSSVADFPADGKVPAETLLRLLAGNRQHRAGRRLLRQAVQEDQGGHAAPEPWRRHAGSSSAPTSATT